MKLVVLPKLLCVCRLETSLEIPPWVFQSSFFTISKISDELSIVCEQKFAPKEIKAERNFRALKVLGPLEFNLTGILSSIARPLAEANISIFAISTYDTDYILVKEQDLNLTSSVLKQNRFEILTDE